jgi:hypothetical protein
MATSSIGRLTVDLMAKTAGIEKGTRQGRKEFRDLEKTVKSVEKAIGASMAVAGAAVVGYGAAVAKVATDNIKLIATQADLAQSMNATVTGLRAVSQAAADNSIGELDGSLARLHRRLGAVENGGGPAANAIKQLNLSTRELAAADADEKLAMIADAIQKSGVSSQQATRYLQDMGFEQRGVFNLFKDGGDAIRGYREQIEATGRAVNDIEAVQIQQAALAMGSLGDATEGVKTQLAVQLAPIISEVAKLFNDWTSSSIDGVSGVEKAINATIESMLYMADVLHGVKTTGKVAFLALQQVARIAVLTVLDLAYAITNGPVAALNVLIETANMIPGVNLGLLPPIDAALNLFNSFKSDFIQANEDIHNALMEPMPSDAFRNFVNEAREASRAAAEQIIADRADLNNQMSEMQYGLTEEELEKLQEKLNAELETLRTHGLTKQELLLEELEDRQVLLDEALLNGMLSEDDYRAANLQAEEAYARSMKQISDAMYADRLKAAQNALSSLSTLMNSHSRKAFEVGKAAAIANTIVNTAQAAMGAYASLSGIPIVGPALGIAAAAAAGIAGAAQIQQINRTKFGSGSAGVSNTQAISNASEPVSQQSQQQSKTVYLSGIDENSFVRAGSLVEMVNEELKNGGQLVF